MRKVRKAVITAAGRGTRQYPASSAVQKEMFPLVDRDGLTKPIIQIIGEEAIDSGIEELCIITQPGEEKQYREYFRRLDDDMVKSFRGKDWAILESEKLAAFGERLHFAEQGTPEGFGHAVYQAKKFVGDDPFLLMLGDHVYVSDIKDRCARQLVKVHEQNKLDASTGVQPTVERLLHLFGTIKGEPVDAAKGIYSAQLIDRHVRVQSLNLRDANVSSVFESTLDELIIKNTLANNKDEKPMSNIASIKNAQAVVERLKSFQTTVRDALIRSRESAGDLHAVTRSSAADTIYAIDTQVDPLLEAFCENWAAEEGPLVVVAEGLEDEQGREVESRTFPHGANEADAALRLIVDPIDGTRGIMYDKRSAWALAGVAPNKGPATRLQDIEVSVMSELPTSKMGRADVLWAVRGQGARAERVELSTGRATPLPLAPSCASKIDHGFASVSDFFPGTKVLAGELMEHLASKLIGPADVTRATVFEDQYISTGGQWYELIVGHDRFNADLRPAFYRIQRQPEGLCCHPYDCATWLIAQEAGVILTDERGQPLDGPLDTTTGLCWIGYANEQLRAVIEPLLLGFLRGCRA